MNYLFLLLWDTPTLVSILDDTTITILTLFITLSMLSCLHNILFWSVLSSSCSSSTLCGYLGVAEIG